MAAILTATGSLHQISCLTPAFASVETTVLADRLLAIHADPTSASVIGNALLKGVSARPGLDQVVQDLMRRLDIPTQRMSTLSPLDLRTRLKRKTSKEFQLGQTTYVQGWVLGETETWLCGLAALRAG